MAKRTVKKVITHGFTLIEMLLVLVVISMILWAGLGYMQQKTMQMRIDRTTLQMQQILNAGIAYYLVNGSWPSDINTLYGTYLPTNSVVNAWGQPYTLSVYSKPAVPASYPNLYVSTAITQSSTSTGTAAGIASVIAGTLPLSYTSSVAGNATTPPDSTQSCVATTQTCYAVASITVPGQELSNARSVNFAGLFKHGGCIPVPQCPADPQGHVVLTPQVMVVPVSVSGINDKGSNSNVYPISSFTAYARGSSPTLNNTPPSCFNGDYPSSNPDCSALANSGQTANAYWRACLQVITEKGDVQLTRDDALWGSGVTLMAITRCAVTNEPGGSTFTIYSH